MKTLNLDNAKNAVSNTGKGGSKGAAAKKAAAKAAAALAEKEAAEKAALAAEEAAKAAATATAGTAAVKKVSAAVVETLKAVTCDAGATTVSVKRHTLAGESKCAAIKRLMLTGKEDGSAYTKKEIAALVKDKHAGTESALLSTISTLYADMRRAGHNVRLTLERAHTRGFKAATVAVLKLRGAEVGGSKYTVAVTKGGAAAATAAAVESKEGEEEGDADTATRESAIEAGALES